MKRADKYLIGLAVLLLAAQCVLQIRLARLDSQTTDEGVHLSAGYTYLKYDDFRFNPEHPPLVKLLSARPLLGLNLAVPDQSAYWYPAGNFFYDSWKENIKYAEEFFYKLGNDPTKLLQSGRLANIFLTTLLGLTILAVATRLWGAKGGLLATALFVFDPTVTAHGHLITTDIAAALGYLLTTIFLWRFLQKPNFVNTAILGCAIGLAELFKFTQIIIYPAAILMLIIFGVFKLGKKTHFWRSFLLLLVAFFISYFVIWAGYGFNSQKPPVASSISQIWADTNNTPVYSGKVAHLFDSAYQRVRLVLVPRDYFKGLGMVLLHTNAGHSSYLLGQSSNSGWWYYFPVLFIFKTPLPTLLLFVAMLIFVIRRREKRAIFLLIAGAIYFAFAMITKANLGLRHILPIYPLLFIATGFLVASANKKIHIFIYAMIILLAIEFAVAFPYYLSYFNELSGGSTNGYKIATDSNLDWGQDLYRIKNYLNTHDLGIPYVEYGWAGEPSLDYFGIIRRPLDQIQSDKTGFLIIGASAKQSQRYQWLDQYQIYDRITPSVFVYDLNQKGI